MTALNTAERRAFLKRGDVATKLQDAFDRETVTKKFFDRFQNEHNAFQDRIAAIADAADRRCYTRVLLNRILFLYFLQSKGFLDGDLDYLKNRLTGSAAKYGVDRFYRSFLCPLFFEVLAKREGERKEPYKTDLGKLPFLSDSLFAAQGIEARNAAIDLPDAAFEKLFAFLSEYNWHLDDRPVAGGKHINPDVLGYIFEKYTDQKQMGAYYTKQDITEYLSKNTILPLILERAVAFSGECSVWRFLSEDPDRYIYSAVRKGVDLPLPANIEAGVSDVSKRDTWNKPAFSEYALPTEIWREVVARRQRYAEVREKLEGGEVTSAGDLVTLNLDIRQFTQDVVEHSEDADLLRAVWETLNGSSDGTVPPLSVLDPTCGSGAFLFAALEILQPLYTACVERMRGFVDDADRLGRPNDHKTFRATLAEITKHPIEPYFILKKIITHNLFGVDLMAEATEICRLRLFLKLAAHIDPDETKENLGIEPLPDIDFNLRAGNTLVGFATDTQMSEAASAREGEDDKWHRFKISLEEYDHHYQQFLQMQERGDFSSAFAEQQKAGLQAKLQPLRDQADELLAHQYGKIGAAEQKQWCEKAKPFHWFVEFYRTLRTGGFDCIIGNPPYIEYSKVRGEYTIKGYSTEPCGNLYGFCIERSLTIQKTQTYLAMIIPISAFANQSMTSLQNLLKSCSPLYVSTFHQRPAQLFDGVLQRLSLFIVKKDKQVPAAVYSTEVYRWYTEAREPLFQKIGYVSVRQDQQSHLLKVGTSIEQSILNKFWAHRPLSFYLETHKTTPSSRNSLSYRTAGGGYWWTFLTQDFPTESLSNKKASFQKEYDARLFLAVGNSTLFWWYYCINYDLFNLKDYMLFAFRFNYPDRKQAERLIDLAAKLEADLYSNRHSYVIRSKTRGNKPTLTYKNAKSKPILDEIDRELASHYGFTEEELDFILHYDLKYRRGASRTT